LEGFLTGNRNAWKADVRAILFDLDGTLRHSHPTFMQAFLQTAESLNISATSEKKPPGEPLATLLLGAIA
jgi:phosphoglycolate phosphatase-like HAD superfamily hydrolase